MASSVLLEFKGRVVDSRRQLIPGMLITRIESDDGKVTLEMDTHEELIVFHRGQEVEVYISRTKPEYREEIDYVVHATLASLKEAGEGENAYLFSAGGLLFMLRTPLKLDVKPTEKVFIKVAPTQVTK
ncbi:MAG: hypothetical protein DSY37_04845 [Hyperthermus sp.]|nr:MAG: hypothetical protein DSY37_04845 [Hyperthermus sp.]